MTSCSTSFKSIKNKKDMEQYEQFPADEPTRQDFYMRLRACSLPLWHISLSSDKLLDIYTDADADQMKRDWKLPSELKRSGTTALPGNCEHDR